MNNLPDKSGFTTTDYQYIQKYLGVPLMRIGLVLMLIDFVGRIYEMYTYNQIIPPLSPFNYWHGQLFIIGLTIMVLCHIFIYLDNHPTTKH